MCRRTLAARLSGVIDLLDKQGELIDRMKDKKSFEGEAKTIAFDHTILAYVIQYIDQVEITLEAELD